MSERRSNNEAEIFSILNCSGVNARLHPRHYRDDVSILRQAEIESKRIESNGIAGSHEPRVAQHSSSATSTVLEDEENDKSTSLEAESTRGEIAIAADKKSVALELLAEKKKIANLECSSSSSSSR